MIYEKDIIALFFRSVYIEGLILINGSTSVDEFENKESTIAAAFANIGIAGRWSFVNKFFINTQAKYSIATDEYWDSYFTLTAGVGYRF